MSVQLFYIFCSSQGLPFTDFFPATGEGKVPDFTSSRTPYSRFPFPTEFLPDFVRPRGAKKTTPSRHEGERREKSVGRPRGNTIGCLQCIEYNPVESFSFLHRVRMTCVIRILCFTPRVLTKLPLVSPTTICLAGRPINFLPSLHTISTIALMIEERGSEIAVLKKK